MSKNVKKCQKMSKTFFRSTKKENEEMEGTIKKQEKQITAQRFVMNNLRNGIEYLKDHCKRDRTDSEKERKKYQEKERGKVR